MPRRASSVATRFAAKDVLGAGEAVGEQSRRRYLPGRQVEPAGKRAALAALERHPLHRRLHGILPAHNGPGVCNRLRRLLPLPLQYPRQRLFLLAAEPRTRSRGPGAQAPDCQKSAKGEGHQRR
jgi:hypothetical protein